MNEEFSRKLARANAICNQLAEIGWGSVLPSSEYQIRVAPLDAEISALNGWFCDNMASLTTAQLLELSGDAPAMWKRSASFLSAFHGAANLRLAAALERVDMKLSILLQETIDQNKGADARARLMELLKGAS